MQLGNQMRSPDMDEIMGWLADVPDPEIPVISIVDLGIVRSVEWIENTLEVTVTPTYSGCPATSVIAQDIETTLRARGIEKVNIARTLSPAWTTDWLSTKAKEKLAQYGIAPPQNSGGPKECPRCHARNIEKISEFGSTPCKAQWRCRTCLEPFDYFKCI